MKLIQEQKDVIIGSLLGDGNLQTETQGRTWRYRALHQDRHRKYLEYKYGVLKNLCSTGIIYGEYFDERTMKVYKRNYFNTQVQECLKHYGDIFYTYDTNLNKFVKDVPKTLEEVLTPRALAIMYQDDGALKWKGHSNAMRICTESFTLEGLNIFKSAMKNLYNINITLNPKKKNGVVVGYRVAIPEASSAAFVSLIKPYLIDCMKYKVSDGNYGSLG